MMHVWKITYTFIEAPETKHMSVIVTEEDIVSVAHAELEHQQKEWGEMGKWHMIVDSASCIGSPLNSRYWTYSRK